MSDITVVQTDGGTLGDTIASFPAIAERCARDPSRTVRVWFANSAASKLFKVPLNAVVLADMPDRFDFKLSASDAYRWHKQCHMTQAYYIGLSLVPPLHPPLPDLGIHWDEYPESREYDFIVSPFSNTDINGNKKWPMGRWRRALEFLRKRGRTLVIGTPSDAADWVALGEVRGVDRLSGAPLPDVMRHIANCRMVISIDNGISHVTAAIGGPHFLLYPAVLPICWVSNPNANAHHLHVDPRSLRAEDFLTPLYRALTTLRNPT